MSRVVYIGGFGNGEESAAKVAESLSAYYGEVDTFTFSAAQRNADKVDKSIHRAEVFTHSAGILHVVGLEPEFLHVFNGPIPTSRAQLLARTGLKTCVMHSAIRSREDALSVARYDRSTIKELAAHPISNFKPLVSGQISRFDTVQAMVEAKRSDVASAVAYTDGDVYFQPTADYRQIAKLNDIPFVSLPGQHDELVLNPDQTLANYFNQFA